MFMVMLLIRKSSRVLNIQLNIFFFQEISPGLVKTHFHDEMAGSREKALEMYNSGKVTIVWKL